MHLKVGLTHVDVQVVHCTKINLMDTKESVGLYSIIGYIYTILDTFSCQQEKLFGTVQTTMA